MARFNSSDLVIYATDMQGEELTISVDRDALTDFAVEKLLPMYNRYWRDSSSELDRDEFPNRLALPDFSNETTLDAFGFARIRLKTEDMFLDHDAYVLVERSGQPRMVSIE